MKRLYVLALLTIVGVMSYSQKLSFDSKYVKVGVVSNEWPSCMANNPNLRKIASLPGSSIDEERIGKQVLDVLFQRDASGLHMDRLYEEALQNTTIEELEAALLDASAEAKDVLKKEVGVQLLKNNYIVIFRTKTINKQNGKTKIKKFWSVYHVEISDRIIQQAYLNWQDPYKYDQIKVPVKLVAQGKVPLNILDDEKELIYDIAKKVPAFAVRGPVISRYPFTAQMGSEQSLKKGQRIYVYRFKEDGKGNAYSKKICTTRSTEVSPKTTRMYSISGTFPSTKKGDIAVLKDNHRSSVSLMGQASFGDDSRYGGRLQYEYLLDFSKRGIAQYFLAAAGYNRHTKEPAGIWWDDSKTIQPALNNANISLGYGVGFNILGRLEIMPYVMAGYQYSFVTGDYAPMYYWDNDETSAWAWKDLCKKDDTFLHYQSFIAHGGVRVSLNLWFPLQIVGGADYNYATKESSLAPLLDRHKLDRINFYAGIRLHF